MTSHIPNAAAAAAARMIASEGYAAVFLGPGQALKVSHNIY